MKWFRSFFSFLLQCPQVVSVKTEDSILQEVSEHIRCTAKSNDQHRIQENDVQLNVKRNVEVDSEEYHRAELQKQVEIGEITPFEAIFKQSTLEKEGYNNNSFHL